MQVELFSFFYNVNLLLKESGIFIVFICIETIMFVINLILSLTKKEYSLTSRLYFLSVIIAVFILHLAVSLFLEYNAFLLFVNLSFLLLITMPMLTVKKRVKVCTEKHRELARFFEKKAKDEQKNNNEQQFGITPKSFGEVIKSKEEERLEEALPHKNNDDKQSDYGLDFSHVKNVIARLDYFGISQTDKRQVRELESALLRAEKGEQGEDVKREINDGLGAILKIMSKYGI